MTETDFPDMGPPLYSFYRTGFENCRKPSIVRADPEGGDPHIIAVLGRIYDPERLQDLVNAKNREILAEARNG